MKLLAATTHRLAPSRFEIFGWERLLKLLGPQSYDVVLAIALAVGLAAASRALVG